MKSTPIFFICCLLTGIAFSQQQQKLHPHTKVLFFGDSHTAYGFGYKENSVQYQNHGYVAWVNALCPDVQIPKGGILAVPGETTVQMQKRMSAIRNFDAKILVVLAGTNDVLYPVPLDTIKRNLRNIYNTGIAAGMKVIAITILPQFSSSYYDIIEGFRNNVNAWIRSQSDITVIDADKDLNNKALYEDEVHLNPQGALMLAEKVAAIINPLTAHCLPGSGNSAQLSVAGNANPFLTGTDGKKSGATGIIATNWELAGAFAGNASVSGSKEAVSEGKEKQLITITGLYTGNNRRVTFTNNAVAPIALQPGDVVEGVAEIEIPSMPLGIKGIYLKVTANNADYSLVLAEGNSMFNTSENPVNIPSGHYILRTPPITVGNGGSIAYLTTQVVFELNNTVTLDSVSAKLKFSSVGIRRLQLSNGPLAGIHPSDTQSVCPSHPLTLKAEPNTGYTYQWVLNGKDIAGQTAANLSVTQAGSYAVKVLSNSCAVLSEPVAVEGCTHSTVQNKWTGAVSTAWEHPGNWSLNTVPDASTNVIIESGNVVVSSDAICRTLVSGAGVRLTVKTGKNLRVLQ